MVTYKCYVGNEFVGTYQIRAGEQHELIPYKLIFIGGKGFDIQKVDHAQGRLDGIWT